MADAQQYPLTTSHATFEMLTFFLMCPQVAAKQMVGIYLTVWVRRPLLQHIRGLQVACIGTGIMGYLGNKGMLAA